MEIKIYKSDTEMIAFLRTNGCTVKKEKRTIYHSVYHNDIESEDIKRWVVYKNGKELDEGLEDSFETIFSNKLYDMVKNYKS